MITSKSKLILPNDLRSASTSNYQLPQSPSSAYSWSFMYFAYRSTIRSILLPFCTYFLFFRAGSSILARTPQLRAFLFYFSVCQVYHSWLSIPSDRWISGNISVTVIYVTLPCCHCISLSLHSIVTVCQCHQRLLSPVVPFTRCCHYMSVSLCHCHQLCGYRFLLP